MKRRINKSQTRRLRNEHSLYTREWRLPGSAVERPQAKPSECRHDALIGTSALEIEAALLHGSPRALSGTNTRAAAVCGAVGIRSTIHRYSAHSIIQILRTSAQNRPTPALGRARAPRDGYPIELAATPWQRAALDPASLPAARPTMQLSYVRYTCASRH